MSNVDLEARVKARMASGGMPAVYEELALVLSENPSDEQALRLRAAFRCLDDYNRELSLDPGNADLRRFRSRAKALVGDYAGAIEDLTAVAEQTGKAEVWIELAMVLAQMGDPESALEPMNTAVKTEPGWLTFLHRGILKVKLMRWKEALPDIDSAVLDLLDMDANLNYRQQALAARGKCNFMLDDADALMDFDAAIDLKPDDAESLCLRGSMRAARGDAEGLKDLDESVRLAPGVAITYAYRGDVHFKRGAKPSALSDYRKAIELDPTFEAVLNDRLRLAGL